MARANRRLSKLGHLRALLTDAIDTALRSIWSNRQRGLLTALGVIAGTMAFTGSYGVMWGDYEDELRELRRLGATYVSVSARHGLRAEYGVELVTEIPSLTRFTSVYSSESTIRTRLASADAHVLGSNAAIRRMYDLRVTDGRFFTDGEVRSAADVVVIGAGLARSLRIVVHGKSMPTVELFGQPFRVVGVMEARRGEMPGCGDYDTCVVMPETTLREMAPNLPLAFLVFQATSEGAVSASVEAIRYRLRRMLAVSAFDRDPFEIHQAADLIQRIESEINAGAALILGIVCFTLLVGGIGVMNIMLVTVVERTPEIGLRKAVGARSTEILLQFLIESLCLCTGGGLLGTGLGVVLAYAFIDIIAPGVKPVLPAWILLTSIGFAVMTGLAFGFMPATKAAKLSPMEALRRD